MQNECSTKERNTSEPEKAFITIFSGPFCEKDRAQFIIISLIIKLLNFQIHD
jgi:hypothetical protein